MIALKLDTIGANIRKVRLQRKMRQEDLAEKTDLSPNYIGAIERGEKIPSLETLLLIINTLNVSSDVILCDVVDADYNVKASLLSSKIEGLSKEDKESIYAVIDTMVSHCKKN